MRHPDDDLTRAMKQEAERAKQSEAEAAMLEGLSEAVKEASKGELQQWRSDKTAEIAKLERKKERINSKLRMKHTQQRIIEDELEER